MEGYWLFERCLTEVNYHTSQGQQQHHRRFYLSRVSFSCCPFAHPPKNYKKMIKKQKNKKTPRRGYDGASTALGLTHHFAPLEHKRRVDDRQRRLPTLSRVLSSSLVALYNPRAFTRTTRALQKTEAMTSQHSSRKFSAYQVFRSTEVSTHTYTYREEAEKR